jgi:hypothetical protein
MGYGNDRRWSDQFLGAIKKAIYPYVIGVAPDDEDQRHNTDLLVLSSKCQRVACRVRRGHYAARYGDQFTLRCQRDSGAQTELAKISAGWGDYLFYGFEGSRPGTLARWTLADLSVFRQWYDGSQGSEVPNGDGSWFRAFRWNDLPPQFVISRSPSAEDRLMSALIDLFDLTSLAETEEDQLARWVHDRRRSF